MQVLGAPDRLNGNRSEKKGKTIIHNKEKREEMEEDRKFSLKFHLNTRTITGSTSIQQIEEELLKNEEEPLVVLRLQRVIGGDDIMHIHRWLSISMTMKHMAEERRLKHKFL